VAIASYASLNRERLLLLFTGYWRSWPVAEPEATWYLMLGMFADMVQMISDIVRLFDTSCTYLTFLRGKFDVLNRVAVCHSPKMPMAVTR